MSYTLRGVNFRVRPLDLEILADSGKAWAYKVGVKREHLRAIRGKTGRRRLRLLHAIRSAEYWGMPLMSYRNLLWDFEIRDASLMYGLGMVTKDGKKWGTSEIGRAILCLKGLKIMTSEELVEARREAHKGNGGPVKFWIYLEELGEEDEYDPLLDTWTTEEIPVEVP